MVHPVTLVALGALALNDHVLKRAVPGVVTGKVSDVAGLVVAPLVLIAACEWCRRAPASAAIVAGAVATVGVGFVAVKSSAWVASAYSDALGVGVWGARSLIAWVQAGAVPSWEPWRVRADVTDLACLPALAVAWWVARRRVGHKVAAA